MNKILVEYAVTLRTSKPARPEKCSSFVEILLRRSSDNDVRFSVGKFVPRTTYEVRDNSKYTEPGCADFSVFSDDEYIELFHASMSEIN